MWFSIAALGLYHGANPAMGWPLAVANGLARRRAGAVFATLLPLGAGHLAAMAVILLPFAWLGWFLEWNRALRVTAGAAVFAFGLLSLLRARHARFLARIPPSRIAWWSFLAATAHGAGLMLVPFMLGLCAAPGPENAGGFGHGQLMNDLGRASLGLALAIAAVHTLAMLTAGTVLAWVVYRWLGLRFLKMVWFNLDIVWAISLLVAGAAGVFLALRETHAGF